MGVRRRVAHPLRLVSMTQSPENILAMVDMAAEIAGPIGE
jgi:hypothetical protein